MSNYKYRHLMAAKMNKMELYEKGINRKPRLYELVSYHLATYLYYSSNSSHHILTLTIFHDLNCNESIGKT